MASPLDLEEQEQLDEFKHFWNRWGNLISWVLILVLGGYAACHFGRIGLTALAGGFLGPSTSDGHADAVGQFTRQCLAVANATAGLGGCGHFGRLVTVTSMALELARLGRVVHVAHLPVASSKTTAGSF